MMQTAKAGGVRTRSAGNDTIDLLKFLGSIMIFTMHISAFRDCGQLVFVWEILSRWAVPFFFVTSAYFLFSKGENGNITRAHLGKYIKRIAALYALWLLINLPSVFYSRLYTPGIQELKTWLLFFRSAFLSSTFTGSWYLMSCIFSAFFVYLLSKKLRIGTVLAVTFLLQTVCILTSVYSGFVPESIGKALDLVSFPLNIFGGVFYFALGKFLFEKQNLFKRLRAGDCLFLALLFYGVYIVEIYFAKSCGVYKCSDQAFSLLPLSAFLLLACQKSALHLRSPKTLRKMSTVIYCCQGNILLFVPMVLKQYGVTASLTVFAVGALCAVGMILIVFALQKCKKCKFAGYLT